MTMGVVEFFLKELQCNVLLSGNIVVVIGRSVVGKNIDVKPWTSSFSVNWENSSIIVFAGANLIQYRQQVVHLAVMHSGGTEELTD